MPSLESIDVQHLAGVTGGRMRGRMGGGMCPPGGQQHGFAFAYNYHYGDQQQPQQVAAATPEPRREREVSVGVSHGVGATPPPSDYA